LHAFLVPVSVFTVYWLIFQIDSQGGEFILNGDAGYQFSQAIGDTRYSMQHPLIHTFLLSLFISVFHGYLPAFTLFQCFVMATAIYFTFVFLKKSEVNSKLNWALLLVFSFFPTFALGNLGINKDFLFTPFMLVLPAMLVYTVRSKYEILNNPKFLTGLSVVLFFIYELRRQSAPIIFILLIFILIRLFILKKQKIATLKSSFKKFAIMSAILLSSIFLFNYAVGTITNAEKITDNATAFSVPIQQIAAVLNDDNTSVPDDIRQRMYNVVPETAWQQYDPDIVDPIKGYSDFFGNNSRKTFILDWLRLGKRNPGIYLQAYWDLMSRALYVEFPKDIGYHELDDGYKYDGITYASGNNNLIRSCTVTDPNDWSNSGDPNFIKIKTANDVNAAASECYYLYGWNNRIRAGEDTIARLARYSLLRHHHSISPALVDGLSYVLYGSALTKYVLFNTALPFWLLILSLIVFSIFKILKRQTFKWFDFLIILTPSLIYFAVNILTLPVVAFRYQYPILVSMLVIVFVMFGTTTKGARREG
jgi:hypothetical protein